MSNKKVWGKKGTFPSSCMSATGTGSLDYTDDMTADSVHTHIIYADPTKCL